MTMNTIAAFIVHMQLRMTCTRVPARTDTATTDTWHKTARHFLCTISSEGKGNAATLTVFFSQGSAHTKPPTLADVLDSLASDASGAQYSDSFASWCADYGLDADSRSAHKTYKACKQIARDLKTLLGAEAMATLLNDTERL